MTTSLKLYNGTNTFEMQIGKLEVKRMGEKVHGMCMQGDLERLKPYLNNYKLNSESLELLVNRGLRFAAIFNHAECVFHILDWLHAKGVFGIYR